MSHLKQGPIGFVKMRVVNLKICACIKVNYMLMVSVPAFMY